MRTENGGGVCSIDTQGGILRADLPPICLQCTTSNGLCTRHVPDVCPRLKQPSWHQHVHHGERDSKTARKYSPAETAAVRRARRREERKRLRQHTRQVSKQTRQVSRMVRLIGGEHVPVSRSA